MAFYHDLKGYGPEKAAWIAQRLLELRADLELQIRVRRRSNSLIIGSWNIRAFDDGRGRSLVKLSRLGVIHKRAAAVAADAFLRQQRLTAAWRALRASAAAARAARAREALAEERGRLATLRGRGKRLRLPPLQLLLPAAAARQRALSWQRSRCTAGCLAGSRRW